MNERDEFDKAWARWKEGDKTHEKLAEEQRIAWFWWQFRSVVEIAEKPAAPAAPAYVPLSDDKIMDIIETIDRTSDDVGPHFDLARAIEALVVARMRGEGK
jgi:hypothetical protein